MCSCGGARGSLQTLAALSTLHLGATPRHAAPCCLVPHLPNCMISQRPPPVCPTVAACLTSLTTACPCPIPCPPLQATIPLDYGWLVTVDAVYSATPAGDDALEVDASDEDRDMWRVYLDKGDYRAALVHCRRSAHWPGLPLPACPCAALPCLSCVDARPCLSCVDALPCLPLPRSLALALAVLCLHLPLPVSPSPAISIPLPARCGALNINHSPPLPPLPPLQRCPAQRCLPCGGRCPV